LISLKDIETWLIKANSIYQEKKAYLTQLDQAIGDGDHGINLARGFQEVSKKVTDHPSPDIGTLLKNVGMTLLSKVGGASGPLYGTAFLKMGSALKEKREATPGEFAHALAEAAGGIQLRGKARVGDKTMLDVWKPVADLAVKQGNRLSWRDLLECSRSRMEATKDREAKKGRAAYLGQRSVGHLDPGAVSTHYLFEALYETMEKEETTG
jgi:phosphoenolpyruvate---glycerone phosphotransferase subunit DhaL